MQICTNMSWLRHYQGRLMLFWGVTYITCCYTLTLPLSESLHLLFCVLYNVVLDNYSVQNSPWGGGGSIASSRPNTLYSTFKRKLIFSYHNDFYHTYGTQHAYPYGRNTLISKSMCSLVKEENY